MRFFYVLFTLIGLTTLSVQAQPEVRWEQTYSFNHLQGITGEVKTLPHPDGGYYIATTAVNQAGDQDYFLLHIAEAGNVLWSKQIGSNAADRLVDFEPLSNGTFLLGGSSAGGNSRDKSQPALGEGSDAWLVWVNKYGHILKDRTYGSESDDRLLFIGSENIASDQLIFGYLSFTPVYNEADNFIVTINKNTGIQAEGSPHLFRQAGTQGELDEAIPAVSAESSSSAYVVGYTPFAGLDLLTSETGIFQPSAHFIEETTTRLYDDDRRIELNRINEIIRLQNNDLLFFGDAYYPNLSSDYSVFKLSPTGQEILWAYPQTDGSVIQDIPMSGRGKAIAESADGGFYLTGENEPNYYINKLEPAFNLGKIDANGRYLYQEFYGPGVSQSLLSFDDNSLLLVGQTKDSRAPGSDPGELKLIRLAPERPVAGRLLIAGAASGLGGDFTQEAPIFSLALTDGGTSWGIVNFSYTLERGDDILKRTFRAGRIEKLNIHSNGNYAVAEGKGRFNGEPGFSFRLHAIEDKNQVWVQLFNPEGNLILLSDSPLDLSRGRVRIDVQNSTRLPLPNPLVSLSQEGIRIELPEHWQNQVQLSLYNLQGHPLAKTSLNKTNIEWKPEVDIKRGSLYLIKLSDGVNQYSTRMMIR